MEVSLLASMPWQCASMDLWGRAIKGSLKTGVIANLPKVYPTSYLKSAGTRLMDKWCR